MAETKEAYLNHTYFGPTVAPQQQPMGQRPMGRPLGCLSSSPTFRGCTPYSLLCTVFKMFTTVLIIIGAVVLVLWLVYQPSTLKVFVESADLTQFSLNNSAPGGGGLYYNLSMRLTVRNPNSRTGMYYKHVQATAFYAGSAAKLGDVVLPLYYQPKKNTTDFNLSFVGGPLAVGEGVVNETYARERGEGWFYFTVKMYTKVRIKMVVLKSVEYTPEADCSFRLPAPANASSASAGFQRTQCHVDEFS